MKTNVIPKDHIKIDAGMEKYVSSIIIEEDLEVLSRISNGPNIYTLKKFFTFF